MAEPQYDYGRDEGSFRDEVANTIDEPCRLLVE